MPWSVWLEPQPFCMQNDTTLNTWVGEFVIMFVCLWNSSIVVAASATPIMNVLGTGTWAHDTSQTPSSFGYPSTSFSASVLESSPFARSDRIPGKVEYRTSSSVFFGIGGTELVEKRMTLPDQRKAVVTWRLARSGPAPGDQTVEGVHLVVRLVEPPDAEGDPVWAEALGTALRTS